MISVILPSRGRPESLYRAVSSLAYGDVEILVGLDSDDPTAGEAERLLAEFPQARVHINPRMGTLHVLDNHLAKRAQGDFLMVFTDDYTIPDYEWAQKVETSFVSFPDGWGIAYPMDAMYPHFSTFPILPRKLVDLAGYFLPPVFPFLFGDTWWNEVGVMSALIAPVPGIEVKIDGDTGHIHNYRDLKLWSEIFHATRPLREELAMKLIDKAVGGTKQADYLVQTMEERKQALIQLHAPFLTDEFCNKWDKVGDGFPHPHYTDLKTKAVAFMEAMSG